MGFRGVGVCVPPRIRELLRGPPRAISREKRRCCRKKKTLHPDQSEAVQIAFRLATTGDLLRHPRREPVRVNLSEGGLHCVAVSTPERYAWVAGVSRASDGSDCRSNDKPSG